VEADDFLLIGRITSAHGIKGALKVFSFAESPSVFESGRLIHLKGNLDREKTFTIQWAKPHARGLLLSLEGIDNRSKAESLIGAELFIEKKSLPALEEGTYYWFDIVGLSVFTIDDEYIGQVKSIIPTGSNDVYVVQDKNKEILVPALESVVIDIDLDNKRMIVVLPEGLQ
jgi:16S rRNA processing protein RimM